MFLNLFNTKKSLRREVFLKTSSRRRDTPHTTLPRWSAGVIILLIVGVVVAFFVFGFLTLTRIYNQQCRVQNLDTDITVDAGKTMKKDLICTWLGLTQDVNLASIPITQFRERILRDAPNVRSITIQRKLPNKLNVSIVEREPIARIGTARGCVVDEEGCVFIRYKDTNALPLIKGTDLYPRPGDKLSGIEFASVQLIFLCQRPGCNVRVLEIDISKQDYLSLTLANHSRVKFAWEQMDSMNTRASLRNMGAKLDQLSCAMNAPPFKNGAHHWNATTDIITLMPATPLIP